MINRFINQMREIERSEVESATKPDKSWLIIDAQVFDITRFAEMHPGGELILREYAGKDATDAFYSFHRQEVIEKYERLKIGTVKGEKPKILKNGGISKVPYAEPSYMQGFFSPYYNESHHSLRKATREFLRDNAYEEALQGEESGKPCSKELFQKLGESGLLAMRMGPGPHLKKFKLISGIEPEKFDYFRKYPPFLIK